MTSEPTSFRHCSICKKDIAFEQGYYACSVSTCNRKRTGLFFCSLECWNAHVPVVRHRDAWAERVVAPTREAFMREQEREASEQEGVDDTQPKVQSAQGANLSDANLPMEVLVVVSKLKAYVRARSGMNTSEGVVDVLSDHIRRLANEAIRNAARDGRKTVMDRDFLPLLK